MGLLHLPITFVNAAAPFRGALDPTYPGYVQGLVRADAGSEVGIFAFIMLAGGLASACIAVLNRPGARNIVIVVFDSLLLLTLAPATIGDAAERSISGFSVAFGEALQFSGVPAFLFLAGLLIMPPLIGLLWALRRANE